MEQVSSQAFWEAFCLSVWEVVDPTIKWSILSSVGHTFPCTSIRDNWRWLFLMLVERVTCSK